nr:hypothetical protein [Actinomadura fibrosa]
MLDIGDGERVIGRGEEPVRQEIPGDRGEQRRAEPAHERDEDGEGQEHEHFGRDA